MGEVEESLCWGRAQCSLDSRQSLALADVTRRGLGTREHRLRQHHLINRLSLSLASSSPAAGSHWIPVSRMGKHGSTYLFVSLLTCTFPGEEEEGHPKPGMAPSPCFGLSPGSRSPQENTSPRPLHHIQSDVHIKSAHVGVIRYTGLPVN